MKNLILARKPIKVNEIPEIGLVGKLIEIEKGIYGPIYVFEDEAGLEQPVYGCAGLRGIKEKHIGKKLKVIYKGQPYLKQGNQQFDVEVIDITDGV